MNGHVNLLSKLGVGLLTLTLLAAVPSVADAAGMGFRNDTKSRIIVQGSTVVNGMIRKGPVLVIEPGKTVWDPTVPPGARTVSIVDGLNTQRLLFRDTVPAGPRDQLFSVQTVGGRTVLVPAAMPAPPR